MIKENMVIREILNNNLRVAGELTFFEKFRRLRSHEDLL